jgi:hypothetical protein
VKYNILNIFIISIILALFSCKKESFITDNSAKLSFSTDTVMFDTVFTTIGSTTKQLKVHNHFNKPIKITSIYLSGNSSMFRLNINGKKSNSVRDIEIAADDSMFIFIEVNVDPNNQSTPMVITDSIIFITNGNIQNIQLVAWGQDVNYMNQKILRNDTIWTNSKPFLIYNSMFVDSAKTLTIQPGTKLYFHGKSRLYVYKGTLVVNGTLQNPVIFRGDRLEQSYKDIPGQWEGIFFIAGSKNNNINYAVIRNARIGIRVDTLASLTVPTLTITNSKIENMSEAGIFAQGSTIFAANCLINNCNQYCVDLSIGGSYEFYNCTIANYYRFSSSNTPALNINNWYEDVYGTIQIRPITNAYFGNCIIYGNKELEIGLDSFLISSGSYFNFTFDHCLLKVNSQFNTSNLRYFKSNVFGNPYFKDEENYDYSLDTLSSAINKGDINLVNLYPSFLNYDIINVSRITYGAPDIGTYERKNQK